MRPNRRLVLTERLIPFLAAAVGLVALGGAVMVQFNTTARSQMVAEEIAKLRADLDAVAQLPVAGTAESNDGTIDAMLALQDRMNRLEKAWDERPVETAAAPSPQGSGSNVFSASAGAADAAGIDPSWPTENCIPMGTRFMASTGEETAICQTPVKIKVSAITDDNIMVDGTGVITETAFKPIPGTNCTLNVFSADGAGFAEMRVSCQ